MATVLPIAQRGEAILKLQAAPVAQSEFNSEWLLQLAAAMQTTMLERHGVGIAAPQVYISKRIIIVASRPNPRYPDAPEMDAVVMVNPEILELSPNTCSLYGEVIETAFEGFPARIVQHEVDHLNGVLFVERLN